MGNITIRANLPLVEQSELLAGAALYAPVSLYLHRTPDFYSIGLLPLFLQVVAVAAMQRRLVRAYDQVELEVVVPENR